MPAQLQLPSSTSFSVPAFPSSQVVPASAHAAAQDKDSSKLFKVPFPTALEPSFGSLLLKLVFDISNDKLLDWLASVTAKHNVPISIQSDSIVGQEKLLLGISKVRLKLPGMDMPS